MSLLSHGRAAAAALLAVGAALALSACIVVPGKFDSTFDLRRDGSFTFSYSGEIYLLALSRLAEMSNDAEASDDAYVDYPCFNDDSEERPCTAHETAEQREEQDEARTQRAEREAEQMRQLLGGIDPADPEAAEELAARLRRQQGWKRVEYRGDGIFEIEFSIASRLGHDFTFPTLERFPMSNGFVIAYLRQNDSVRIEAPGFASEGGGSPFQSMMAGIATSFPAAEGKGDGTLTGPEMDGTFRVVTDGRILANNTDGGPMESAAGQVLEWNIDRRTQSPPMALIQLGG